MTTRTKTKQNNPAGEAIQALQDKGYSWNTLGAFLGVSAQTMRRWEIGESRCNSTALKIMRALVEKAPNVTGDGIRYKPWELVKVLQACLGNEVNK